MTKRYIIVVTVLASCLSVGLVAYLVSRSRQSVQNEPEEVVRARSIGYPSYLEDVSLARSGDKDALLRLLNASSKMDAASLLGHYARIRSIYPDWNPSVFDQVVSGLKDQALEADIREAIARKTYP